MFYDKCKLWLLLLRRRRLNVSVCLCVFLVAVFGGFKFATMRATCVQSTDYRARIRKSVQGRERVYNVYEGVLTRQQSARAFVCLKIRCWCWLRLAAIRSARLGFCSPLMKNNIPIICNLVQRKSVPLSRAHLFMFGVARRSALPFIHRAKKAFKKSTQILNCL